MVTHEHNPAPFDVESGKSVAGFQAWRFGRNLAVDEPKSYSRGNRNLVQ